MLAFIPNYDGYVSYRKDALIMYCYFFWHTNGTQKLLFFAEVRK